MLYVLITILAPISGAHLNPAVTLACLVPAQVMMGAITVWSARHPLLTSLHVAGGAALLGTAVLLSLRLHRRAWLSGRAGSAAQRAPLDGRVGAPA